MENLFAVGGQVSMISDLLRQTFILIDILIYSCTPMIFALIYRLYDINSFIDLSNVVSTVKESVYSLLAIFMFFKVAFSLLGMLVDPTKIEDKEKGAGKIVTNIVITLVLIVAVPMLFNYARDLQTKVIGEQMIEKMLMGKDYNSTGEGAVQEKGELRINAQNYTLGNSLSRAVFSVFLRPMTDKGLAVTAYNNIFAGDDKGVLPWAGLNLTINLTTSFFGGIVERLAPGITGIFDNNKTTYQLAYVYIISTIVGVWLAWTMIKLCIDVAYRSIKFLALELMSPIAIITFVEPNSSKNGTFSKWLQETVKTYVSLFVRIFVFAFVSILLGELNGVVQDNGFVITLMYILAIISFIKVAPKFIDNIFGTEMSKDKDTKFGADLLKGAFGGFAVGTTGAIAGGVVAKRTGQNIFKGVVKGAWQGGSKGFTAARKGEMRGVVGAFTDTVGGIKKGYGYERDKEHERELNRMEAAVPDAKKAKTAAIARAEFDKNKEIKNEFSRSGRAFNGYETKFTNLIGDADAEGYYKKFVAIVGENSVIPGLSDNGKRVYANAAYKKMEANLTKRQASLANNEFDTKYSAFVQRDQSGQQQNVIEAFNKENARLANIGATTYSDWQTMYKSIGNMDPSATIDLDSAYKIALDNEIRVKTGHDTSEWTNISTKAESDATGAADEVKRYEKSESGLSDKRKKEIYNEAKGKVEAKEYKGRTD